MIPIMKLESIIHVMGIKNPKEAFKNREELVLGSNRTNFIINKPEKPRITIPRREIDPS